MQPSSFWSKSNVRYPEFRGSFGAWEVALLTLNQCTFSIRAKVSVHCKEVAWSHERASIIDVLIPVTPEDYKQC